jgi:DNA gyrase/topoisomerase IV subunit A
MEERLDGLRALLDAGRRPGAVLEIVTTAASDDDALSDIRELLSCSPNSARLVYDTSLRRLSSTHLDRASQEVEALERAIEQAAAEEASADDRP